MARLRVDRSVRLTKSGPNQTPLFGFRSLQRFPVTSAFHRRLPTFNSSRFDVLCRPCGVMAPSLIRSLMCFVARFVHRGGLRVHVMRRRPFSRQRSATSSRAKFLVDLWNCTVASWSQSVTSSTPFLGFFPASPFAVLIRLGSGFEVLLQILARVLFGESSSRFISVGRQVDAILNTRFRLTIDLS